MKKLTDNNGISTEIKEAKREWKHLHRFINENHILVIAFMIVITSIVIINAVYVINQNQNDSPVSISSQIQDQDDKVLNSLQSGNNGVIMAQVSNATENSKTDHAFTIDPSETMLIADLTIKNLTSQTQQLYPVKQLYVRSSEGDYSALHASMYVTNPLGAQDVKPGQTVSGQVSFNVPKRVSAPLLYIDTGWNNSTPIVFDVLH